MENSTDFDYGQPIHFSANIPPHFSSLLISLGSIDTDVVLRAKKYPRQYHDTGL